LLDDGRLTDGQGRTVDFKNVIVIMTSNIGSYRILDYRGAFEGEEYRRMKDAVLSELRSSFRPEFLNRLDDIIVFHALSEEHLKEIVEIQLSSLRARLEERHIKLVLTERARTRLVQNGYDPHYGARPLKRAIQREIETPLAKLIVSGEIHDGQTIQVDAAPEGPGLKFELQRRPVNQPDAVTV
jgi:ATP-dependent Clp protease ATP-binding subunit ClpB